MFTHLSPTARHLLEGLLEIVDKSTARKVLMTMQPLISDRHFTDVSRMLIELMPEADLPEYDLLMKAIDREPQELFDIACECVNRVTGTTDVHVIRSRRAREVMSRYYVIFVMSEEMHSVGLISYATLGKLFDGEVHHASIIHAKKMIFQYLETDQVVRKELSNIANLLIGHGHWRTAARIKSIEPIWKTPSV
jgi:hypothetical protein